ncbi:MAG: hypothetical protein ACFHXK_07625 [bacterium]
MNQKMCSLDVTCFCLWPVHWDYRLHRICLFSNPSLKKSNWLSNQTSIKQGDWLMDTSTGTKRSVVSGLEIAANLGIVIGLLLVAFQIAQQDEIADTDLMGQLFSEVADHYQHLAGETPAVSMARAIEAPGSLSTEDHVVLNNLYMTEFAKVMRHERIEGYRMPPSTVARWMGLTANPYGYAWWKVQGKILEPFIPQLYAALEIELAKAGPSHANLSRNTMMAVQQELLNLSEVQ